MELFSVDQTGIVSVKAEEDAVPVLRSAFMAIGTVVCPERTRGVRVDRWTSSVSLPERGTDRQAASELTCMYRYNPSNSVKLMLPLLSVSNMSFRQLCRIAMF